jgi:hypothetical protein
MEFGRSGHHGVYVHLHVVEAKEQEQGHAHLLSMVGGPVKDLKHIISLVTLLSVQVSVFCFCHPSFTYFMWSLVFIDYIKGTMFI